jgi:hypothetical protein
MKLLQLRPESKYENVCIYSFGKIMIEINGRILSPYRDAINNDYRFTEIKEAGE